MYYGNMTETQVTPEQYHSDRERRWEQLRGLLKKIRDKKNKGELTQEDRNLIVKHREEIIQAAEKRPNLPLAPKPEASKSPEELYKERLTKLLKAVGDEIDRIDKEKGWKGDAGNTRQAAARQIHYLTEKLKRERLAQSITFDVRDNNDDPAQHPDVATQTANSVTKTINQIAQKHGLTELTATVDQGSDSPGGIGLELRYNPPLSEADDIPRTFREMADDRREQRIAQQVFSKLLSESLGSVWAVLESNDETALDTTQTSNGKKFLSNPSLDMTVTIGRVKANNESDISFQSDKVSSKHAKLERRQGKLYITDLQSTNGTYVNGKKVEAETRAQLEEGDLVLLGLAGAVLRVRGGVLKQDESAYALRLDEAKKIGETDRYKVYEARKKQRLAETKVEEVERELKKRQDEVLMLEQQLKDQARKQEEEAKEREEARDIARTLVTQETVFTFFDEQGNYVGPRTQFLEEASLIKQDQSYINIGRLEENDTRSNLVDLSNEEVLISRNHALLERIAAGFRLTDLGSRFSTDVNGSQIAANKPTNLQENDEIAFHGQKGALRFKVLDGRLVPLAEAAKAETLGAYTPIRMEEIKQRALDLASDLTSLAEGADSLNFFNLSRWKKRVKKLRKRFRRSG